MTRVNDRNRSRHAASALVRPCYAGGNYLAAKDLETEQRYRLQRMRLHTRYLHGWGIVCGLWVVPINDPRRPWAVQVCPGYAIDCCGDEVIVPEPVVVNIRDYLWRHPRHERPLVAYIGVRYTQALTRSMPVPSVGCGCDETQYEPSRIREGFRADALWGLPQGGGAREFDLCSEDPVPCPDCPESRYVLLACVTLPVNEGNPITVQHIDNLSCRR